MIQKTTRIPTSDTRNIAAYLGADGENEEVRWITGSEEDVLAMGQIADALHKSTSVRHQMVSPDKKLTRSQLDRMVELYCDEFDVAEDIRDRICIVAHTKQRANANDGAEVHFQMAIPEVSIETETMIDQSFTHMRNEYLSRVAELEFGHAVTVGRFNRYVADRLEAERPDLPIERFHEALEAAAAEAGQEPDVYQADSQLSSKRHKRFQRLQDRSLQAKKSEIIEALEGQGVSSDQAKQLANAEIQKVNKPVMPMVRQHLKELAEGRDASEFVDHIMSRGDYQVSEGDEPSVLVVEASGKFLGALHRLSPFKKNELYDAFSARKDLQNEADQDLGRGRRAQPASNGPSEPSHQAPADRAVRDRAGRKVPEVGPRGTDGEGRREGAQFSQEPREV